MPEQTTTEYTDRQDGLVQVRTVEVTAEQMHALGALVSIAGRFGRSYEVYGGVNINEAMGYYNAFQSQWWEAKDTARLAEGFDPEPDDEL